MVAKTDPYIGMAYEELLRMSADEKNAWSMKHVKKPYSTITI